MRAFLLTPLVIFMLLIVVLLAKLIDSDRKDQTALIGQKLPEFNLAAAIDDVPGINNLDVPGKYVLLNIFGSWCITCKIEHPFLMKLKQDNIIPIYGIDWRDKKENLENFLKEKGNPYSAIGNDFEGKVVVDLGVTGAPETLLVSPDGIILYRYAGPITEEIWQSKILPILEQKK